MKTDHANMLWRKQRLERYIAEQTEHMEALCTSVREEPFEAYADGPWDELIKLIIVVHIRLLDDLLSPLN